MAAIILVSLVGVQIPKGITTGFERDLLLLVSTLVSAFLGLGMLTFKKQ